MKLLFVPDQLVGQNSGHRSADWFIIQARLHVELAVFTPRALEYERREDLSEVKLYDRLQLSTYDVIKSFDPDLVYFFGASGFTSIASKCSEMNVPFAFHFLTTIFYCPQNFASYGNVPCYACLGKLPMNAILRGCSIGAPKVLRAPRELLRYKGYIDSLKKASIWVGHSSTQIQQIRHYNETCKSIQSPIFFNSDHLIDVETKSEDYYYFGGQSIDSKGWNYFGDLIRSTSCLFKTTFPTELIASETIEKYNLSEAVSSGRLEYFTGIKSHSDFLQITANARGVVILSCYDTTGEFTLLEALGLGKRVFCFEVGFHKDMLKSEEMVVMAQVGDIKGLASAIEEHQNLKGPDFISENGKKFLFSMTNTKEYETFFNGLRRMLDLSL